MTARSGYADLPLHGGRVPAWLATRMAALGRVIAQAIVHHYGADEFLRRLSHPFWFQSFGSVMGMDWHSSGIRDAQRTRALTGLEALTQPTSLPHLQMPARHEVLASDVVLRRLHGTLAAAAERGPRDFADLLLTPGVGARTVAALALVAEVIHGTPSRFTDPARFSLAHGGKDGHPFPVPVKVYDETLRVLKQAVSQARLGRAEKVDALQRLDAHARRLEQSARGPGFETHIETERTSATALGGRTVFDR